MTLTLGFLLLVGAAFALARPSQHEVPPAHPLDPEEYDEVDES